MGPSWPALTTSPKVWTGQERHVALTPYSTYLVLLHGGQQHLLLWHYAPHTHTAIIATSH